MATIRRIDNKPTKEYQAWKAMKSRCYSPSTKNHRTYQRKGIIVCSEWLHDFDKFLEDMGNCPDKFSLDRIDNDGIYSKENCRWTTNSEQTKNRGNFNKVFTYNEKSQVLKDWARELGFKYTTLWLRIYRTGLSFEDAIKEDPFDSFIEYNGEKKRIIDWHKSTGIPYQILVDRKRRNWSVDRMFTQKIKTNIQDGK